MSLLVQTEIYLRYNYNDVMALLKK